MLELDRRALITSLGGAAAVAMMSHEARADALEDFQSDQLNIAVEAASGGPPPAQPGEKFPTVAELEERIDHQTARRGSGNLFIPNRNSGGHVKRLEPMPAKPTIIDFFNLRMQGTSNHVLQSAKRALKTGMSEEIIFACWFHDSVHALMKPDHGWWGAQLVEPYVSEKVTFAIRYHQTLRFYPDSAAGYEYPDLYKRIFGIDYEPPPYIQATYKYVKNHKWYMEPRLVTVNDLYAFDPNEKVALDPFIDIIGRQFKQPKEGLGYDNSPVAHMWRTMINPDAPL